MQEEQKVETRIVERKVLINGQLKTQEVVIPKNVDEVVTERSFLRQVSRATTLKEIEEYKLVERIKRALAYTWCPGFGLAAVQIGILIRAAWYGVKFQDKLIERLIWNPEVIETKGVEYFSQEGCLSIPYQYVPTKRYKEITIKNGDGEIIKLDGLEAIIMQHELDHMDGILCIDREVSMKDKPGRNDPCVCGSGKKYKKCCGF